METTKPGESMTQKNAESREKGGNFGKKLKNTAIVLALLTALGFGAGYFDVKRAEQRKNDDMEKYGKFNVNKGKTATFPVNSIDGGPAPFISVPLDTILGHNYDIIDIDATKLESIMLGEDALTTSKKFLGMIDVKKIDSNLEGKGVDRDPNSQSLIGKILGHIKKGSYGPYQVQTDAIDKYKDDPELYDNLCKRIAIFKLPDSNGEYIPLHEQLGLSLDDMVNQIKNHKIYTFAGGERFLVAYGIVLIDQIAREVESMADSYDGSSGYHRWRTNTKIIEQKTDTDGKLLYPELTKGSNDNIMSPYYLKRRGEVSYQEIGQLFNSKTFRNGMISAYRCMDYINNVKNSDYLFVLSLMELNEWFNNPEGELNIVTPTGSFGPSTTKLVNKYFNKNFDVDDKNGRKEAKKFMEELPNTELQTLKEDYLNKFEQNMRLLYTLNPDDKNGINPVQSKYLSESLDLTFNNLYAAVEIFSKFINNKGGKNAETICNALHEHRENYISDQNQQSLEYIKKVITDKESFISFTGLNKNDYNNRIKYYLCPTILGSTDRVYQTGGIIPVIQKNEGGEGSRNEQGLVNESNSIYRFHLGIEQEQLAQQVREQGVEYVLQPGDTNIDSLRQIMRDTKPIRAYLEKCKTVHGDSIASPQDIPEELVYGTVRGSDGTNPLFEDGNRFYEGDTVYFRYEGLDDVGHIIPINNPVTKEVKKDVPSKKKGKRYITERKTLCTVNLDGTLTMQEGGTFQEILYILCQQNPEIKAMLESVKGSEINCQSDITGGVIEKVVRHPNGKKRNNIDSVRPGQLFRLQQPLNY